MAELESIINKKHPLKKGSTELLQYINISTQDNNIYKLSQFYERITEIFSLINGSANSKGWINQAEPKDIESLGYLYDLFIPEPSKFKNIFTLMINPTIATPKYTLTLSTFPPAVQAKFKLALIKGTYDVSMLNAMNDDLLRKFKGMPINSLTLNSAEYFISMFLLSFYQIYEYHDNYQIFEEDVHPFVNMLASYIKYFSYNSTRQSESLFYFLIGAINDIFIHQYSNACNMPETQIEYAVPKKSVLEAIALCIKYYHHIIERGELFSGQRAIFDKMQKVFYVFFKQGFESSQSYTASSHLHNIYTLWRNFIFPWDKVNAIDALIEYAEHRKHNDISFWKFYVQANIYFYTCLFMDLLDIMSKKASISADEISILYDIMDVYSPNQHKIICALVDIRELEAYAKGVIKDPEMSSTIREFKISNRKDFANLCPFYNEENIGIVTQLIINLESSMCYYQEQSKVEIHQIKSTLSHLFTIKDDINRSTAECKQMKRMTADESTNFITHKYEQSADVYKWELPTKKFELSILIIVLHLIAVGKQIISDSENKE
jgi:hypothetical protein